MRSLNRGFVVVLLLMLGACAQQPADSAASATARSSALARSARGSDGTDARPTFDAEYALVQLRGDPLSTYAKTHPAQGKKIDLDASAVKAYRAHLSALRNDFKAWLRKIAPGAKVTGEFDISLNAVAVKLNGVPLATIAGAPQAIKVEYQGLYYPVADATDPDLAVIHAVEAWGTGGAPGAGQGVKVAIIDTGIDATHPCFADAGYPTRTQLGDRSFTNNKVVVAKVFSNKAPSRGYTAEAVQEHGTHVAGTVACNSGTAAKVDGTEIPSHISGVAPAALLGNYNIFPGDVVNARSEDILDALEAAYADGFDVANLSLGGGAQGFQDLLTIAIDDLDQANMVVAVAAGNSGPGHYTVESPGSAARALTAGAASVGHFLASPITAGGVQYPGVPGEFGLLTTDLTAELAVVTGTGTNGLDTACAALPAGSLTDKIAMVARGACAFSIKIRNAATAGARAVIMSNNVGGDASVMGQDGTADQPAIPAYMVSASDAVAVKLASGNPVTIGVAKAYFMTGHDDIMGEFSGQGPTDVDFRVKPDVVAPGVNVLSSIPHQFCAAPPCFAFFQGTSMATPHLAGSAAFLRAANDGWSAAQIRSAIVNTADQGLTRSTGSGAELDANVIGAGRENLASAAAAKVALDPVSVSFGAVPSGSGQTRTIEVVVTDLGGSGGTYGLAILGPVNGGVSFSVSPAILVLPVKGSTTITVTMTAQKGAATGDHQASLRLTSGNVEVAHAAVYAFVK